MFSELIEVKIIRNSHANAINLPNKSGIYKWWCQKEQLQSFFNQLCSIGLLEDLDFEELLKYVEKNNYKGKAYYCFYIGQTKKSLSSRIKSQHIGKLNKKNPNVGRAISGSTLRQSINALKNGKNIYDENYVDSILDKSLVQWKVIDIDNIDKVEREEINSYIRILNRDDFIALSQKDMEELRDNIANSLKMARTRII